MRRTKPLKQRRLKKANVRMITQILQRKTRPPQKRWASQTQKKVAGRQMRRIVSTLQNRQQSRTSKIKLGRLRSSCMGVHRTKLGDKKVVGYTAGPITRASSVGRIMWTRILWNSRNFGPKTNDNRAIFKKIVYFRESWPILLGSQYTTNVVYPRASGDTKSKEVQRRFSLSLGLSLLRLFGLRVSSLMWVDYVRYTHWRPWHMESGDKRIIGKNLKVRLSEPHFSLGQIMWTWGFSRNHAVFMSRFWDIGSGSFERSLDFTRKKCGS